MIKPRPIETINYISDVIFLLFTVFPCKVKLPKLTRNLISTITNFVYKLPHELRLRIIGN